MPSFFRGAEKGIYAFSGAPRSAIIYCRLCLLKKRFSCPLCQSAHSRSRLHPQIPFILGMTTNKDIPTGISFFVAQRNILLQSNKASSLAYPHSTVFLRITRSSREPLTIQGFLLTFSRHEKRKAYRLPFFVAQRKGFEPLYTFLHNTISNRARSTAPPSLQTAYLLYRNSFKKSTVFYSIYKKFPPRMKFPRRNFLLH